MTLQKRGSIVTTSTCTLKENPFPPAPLRRLTSFLKYVWLPFLLIEEISITRFPIKKNAPVDIKKFPVGFDFSLGVGIISDFTFFFMTHSNISSVEMFMVSRSISYDKESIKNRRAGHTKSYIRARQQLNNYFTHLIEISIFVSLYILNILLHGDHSKMPERFLIARKTRLYKISQIRHFTQAVELKRKSMFWNRTRTNRNAVTVTLTFYLIALDTRLSTVIRIPIKHNTASFEVDRLALYPTVQDDVMPNLATKISIEDANWHQAPRRVCVLHCKERL